MNNDGIILAPVDKKNFENSVVNGFKFEDVQHLVSPECNKKGIVRFWNTDHIGIYNRIKKGNYVLFYRKKEFIYVAKVISKVQSPELSMYAWGGGLGYIFMLEKLIHINCPFKFFKELVGYKENYFLMTLIYLNEERTNKVIQEYGSVDFFIKKIKNKKPNGDCNNDTKKKEEKPQKPKRDAKYSLIYCAVSDKFSRDLGKTVRIGKTNHHPKQRIGSHHGYTFEKDAVFDVGTNQDLGKVEKGVHLLAPRYRGERIGTTEIFEFPHESYYKKFKDVLSLLFKVWKEE